MIRNLKKWKQNKLYRCINDSLVAITTTQSELASSEQSSERTDKDDLKDRNRLPSTKRLCKSYFQIL